jgi:predicted SAM-dependent methyltransferase
VSRRRASRFASLPEGVKRRARPLRSAYRRLVFPWVTSARAPVGAPSLGAVDRVLRSAAGTLGLRSPIEGPRRVELGSGQAPHPGYVHIDVDADAPEVDLMARGPRLPIPDSWATDLLAVHVIEHLAPRTLNAALAEWHRILSPGGSLAVHTPNADALFSALGNRERFWAAQGAIFGYGRHPSDYADPRWMEHGDHRVVFTFDALRDLLGAEGFVDISDRSGVDPCRHAFDWAPFIDDLCLEVTARKP